MNHRMNGRFLCLVGRPDIDANEESAMAKCGAETEIYSRVCGYHRPVRNWNKGKKEEFKDRKTFKSDPMPRERAAVPA